MPEFDVLEFGIAGFAIKLCYVVTILFVGWFVLRGMDRAAGVPFRTVLEKIRENPIASALYYGCRILALAVVCLAVF